jgi:hypothetical protein
VQERGGRYRRGDAQPIAYCSIVVQTAISRPRNVLD